MVKAEEPDRQTHSSTARISIVNLGRTTWLITTAGQTSGSGEQIYVGSARREPKQHLLRAPHASVLYQIKSRSRAFTKWGSGRCRRHLFLHTDAEMWGRLGMNNNHNDRQGFSLLHLNLTSRSSGRLKCNHIEHLHELIRGLAPSAQDVMWKFKKGDLGAPVHFSRRAGTFIFQMDLIEIAGVSPPKHAFHYYNSLKALPL